MRLRARTNLKLVLGSLAASAVILPLCVGFLTWLAVSTNLDEQPQLRLRYVEAELEHSITRSPDGQVQVREDYRPPRGFSMIIADSNGLVTYSSTPLFPPGAKADLASVTAAIKPELGSKSFFSETVESGGAVLGSYYAWMPSTTMFLPPSTSKSIRASLFLLGLVVVVFALGTLVATKLARAVFRLESAARRIAAGDFGFKLDCDEDIREIRDLAEAMDGMRVALREDRDRRARFLAAISHDLRTPLTSIGGYLEAVSDGLAGDPATLKHYVDIMRGKTRILEDRIAGLIEFARMGSEEWRMGFEEIELGPFLESLSREFREDAALMGRDFSYELSAISGLAVAADRTLLTRALENLMSNAIRYSPAGGSVRSKAERATGPKGEALYYLHIDDSGPGVAPAERERIFEPFFRGSASREGEGIGMGLYIVASVIKGHGWDVRAGEAPGGGGRFTVTIPASSLRN